MDGTGVGGSVLACGRYASRVFAPAGYRCCRRGPVRRAGGATVGPPRNLHGRGIHDLGQHGTRSVKAENSPRRTPGLQRKPDLSAKHRPLVSVCYPRPAVLPKPSISLTGSPTVLLPAPDRVRDCGMIPKRKGGSAVSERTKSGLGTASVATILGPLGGGIPRAAPWGPTVFLFAPPLLFAAPLAWRDSLTLAGSNRLSAGSGAQRRHPQRAE